MENSTTLWMKSFTGRLQESTVKAQIAKSARQDEAAAERMLGWFVSKGLITRTGTDASPRYILGDIPYESYRTCLRELGLEDKRGFNAPVRQVGKDTAVPGFLKGWTLVSEDNWDMDMTVRDGVGYFFDGRENLDDKYLKLLLLDKIPVNDILKDYVIVTLSQNGFIGERNYENPATGERRTLRKVKPIDKETWDRVLESSLHYFHRAEVRKTAAGVSEEITRAKTACAGFIGSRYCPDAMKPYARKWLADDYWEFRFSIPWTGDDKKDAEIERKVHDRLYQYAPDGRDYMEGMWGCYAYDPVSREYILDEEGRKILRQEYINPATGKYWGRYHPNGACPFARFTGLLVRMSEAWRKRKDDVETLKKTYEVK